MTHTDTPDLACSSVDYTEAFLRYLSFELYRSPLTVEAYRRDITSFVNYIAPREATHAITADIRGWMALRADQGVSPRSLRRNLQSLRAFFRFLCKRKIISSNPASDLPLPKVAAKLPEFAAEGELQRLLADLNEEIHTSPEAELDHLIIEILYGCGLRQAELLALSDTDIDFARREIKVTGKRNKTRIIPIPDTLCEIIRHWQFTRDASFPGIPHPKPLIATKKGRMSSRTLYGIVNRLLQSTHASRKSPHTLRHSCATSLLNSGADINSIKQLLGHASLASTQIYTHVSFADMKKDWSKAHPRARKPKT